MRPVLVYEASPLSTEEFPNEIDGGPQALPKVTLHKECEKKNRVLLTLMRIMFYLFVPAIYCSIDLVMDGSVRAKGAVSSRFIIQFYKRNFA